MSPEEKVRGGIVLGSISVTINGEEEEHLIRLKLDGERAIIYSNTIKLDSKKITNLNEKIEELTDKYTRDGVKNDALKANTVVAFVDGKITSDDIGNSIRNKKSELNVMHGVSAPRLLKGEELKNVRNIKNYLNGLEKYGYTSFYINEEDLTQDLEKKIEGSGILKEFVAKKGETVDSFINRLEIEEDQTEVSIDLTNVNWNLAKLKTLEEGIIKKYGVNLTIQAKYSESTLNEEIKDKDAFEEIGILPLIDAEKINEYEIEGKKGIYNIKDKTQIEGQTDVVCLMFDQESEETLLKKGVNVVKEIIENVINKINGPQSKFETGKKRALYNQEYKLNLDDQSIEKRVKNLGDLLTLDIATLSEDKNAIVRAINDSKDLFNPAAQSYIQRQMDKGNYIEAIGFILGVVENSVAEEVVKEFELGDGEKFIKEIGSNENQAILMTIIGQMIKGKNLEQIKQKENDYEEEVEMKYPNGVINLKDLVKIIKEEQNMNLDKILRTGIDSETAEDVKGIKAILTDRYGADTTVEKVEVAATLAIRSMLAAA